MNEASIQLDEAETQLQHLMQNLGFDQNEFNLIEARLSSLQDLARKHQSQIEELPERFEALKTQLNDLGKWILPSGKLQKFESDWLVFCEDLKFRSNLLD